MFPNNEQFWEIGAYYNFEILQNPLQARQIILKGLIFLPESVKLWNRLLLLETQIQLLIFQRKSVTNKVLNEHKSIENNNIKEEKSNNQGIGIIGSDSEDEDKNKNENELKKSEKNQEGIS